MCGESFLHPTLICPPTPRSFGFSFFHNSFPSLCLSRSLTCFQDCFSFLSFFTCVFNFPTPPVLLLFFFFSSLCVLRFHLSLHFSLSSFCLSLVNHSSLASSCWAQTSRSLYYTDDRYTTHKTARARAHACTHRGPTASSQRQCRVVAGSDFLTFFFLVSVQPLKGRGLLTERLDVDLCVIRLYLHNAVFLHRFSIAFFYHCQTHKGFLKRKIIRIHGAEPEILFFLIPHVILSCHNLAPTFSTMQFDLRQLTSEIVMLVMANAALRV